jgi:hypothetical protein
MYELNSKDALAERVPGTAAEASASNTLEIEDQVVLGLLLSGKVGPSQVEQALKARRGDEKRPLWRLLAEETDIGREVVFGEAARIFAFDTFALPVAVAVSFLHQHRSHFTEDQWAQMKRQQVHAAVLAAREP